MLGQPAQILRLRVRARSPDPLLTELRIERALNSIELRPISLRSSAIVCIRLLRDPLPGAINLQEINVRPPLAWERALATSVDQLVRNAARPADTRVPANAEAVLFADRAELLACLAMDWCDGSAITHWWWQSLFRATNVTSAVISEWLTSIEYVPAAFAKLAQKGFATMFAGDLPASAVSRLLDEITRKFGLTELSKSVSPSRNEMQPGVPGLSDHARAPVSKPSELLSSSEVPELRTRWAPEAFAPQLDQNARVLLAVALMLERAPSLLRERSFVARLLPSLPAADTLEVIAAPGEIKQLPPHVAAVSDGQAADHSDRKQVLLTSPNDSDRKQVLLTSPSHSDRKQVLLTSPKGDGQTQTIDGLAELSPEKSQPEYRGQRNGQPSQVREQRKSEPVPVLPGHSHGEPAQARVDGEAVVPAVETAHAIEDLQATHVPQSEITAASIEAAIETKLGGIFYVINAALALNLYSDFTRPLEPGIELSIWDFLALIGRELNGKRVEFDPIWPLLATLAGRDGSEQPGARFKPPGEWRMPPDWLNAFPELGEWSYQTSHGRLILRHPAGFDVLDVKLGSRFRMKNIEAILASETRCYSSAGEFKRRRFVPVGVRRRKRERSLDRWTRWIADYLRVRLARSLGIEPVDELTTILFARAARVEVTPARLDVFFSLAELPIEIRLAGLDRDPGWVPAAGRAIAFHYV